MKQTVLDGVVAIEAKAAQVVEDAKTRARQAREKVKADLEHLARRLDQEADAEVAQYRAQVEKGKAGDLAELDRQLAAALAALDKVNAERVAPLVEEVVRLLEQRADGN
jgi:F0F1-type ATP synthase membrane subunit b/b'